MATNRQTGDRWDNLHPDVKRICNAHITLARQRGLDVMFWDGYRDPEDEAADEAKGTSKLKNPLSSYHCWGLAYDLVFRTTGGLPSWDDNHNWQQLAEIGEEVGMFSGGINWGWDWGHFQYSGDYKTGDLIAQYAAPQDFIDEVTKIA